LIQFCGIGYVNAFGAFQDFYTRAYITNESASTISWIGSINAFLVLTSGIYVGVLYDRGYFYHLVYGGTFLISFSLFMLSLIKPDHFYQSFLAQGVGVGLASGLLCVPSMAVVSIYFKKKRTLAMTFVSAGSSFGTFIHPIMLNNLLPEVGYVKTTLFSAVLVTSMLLIGCSLMHPPLSTSTSRPPVIKSIRRFYKEWYFIMLSAGSFLATIGINYPFVYLQLDASKHDINEKLVSYLLVIMNAAGLLGRLSPGLFTRYLGVVHMMVASGVCCSALIFSMASIRNGSDSSIVVITVLYGYFAGIFAALLGPLVAFLTLDTSELGARLGFVYAFSGLGCLIGPPIHGALLSRDFIWWKPAVISGIFTLVGTICFGATLFFVKERKKE